MATLFTCQPPEQGMFLREARAVLPNGEILNVCVTRLGDAVVLRQWLPHEGRSDYLGFTAEQARAVAVEMLACADAWDAFTQQQQLKS